MIRKIYKYVLKPGETNRITAPLGSRPLFVDNQNGELTLWMEVNDRRATQDLLFMVVGTGMEFESGEYIGTAMIGPWVLHVYQVDEPV